MTFLILGIVVLVISFVLALISLIREQKSSQHEEQGEQAKQPENPVAVKPQESPELTEGAVSRPSAAPETPKTEKPQVVQPEPPQRISEPRQPFPWEVKQPEVEPSQGAPQNISNPAPGEIENVTVNSQITPAAEIASPQQEEKKILGEISLKDIPKRD